MRFLSGLKKRVRSSSSSRGGGGGKGSSHGGDRSLKHGGGGSGSFHESMHSSIHSGSHADDSLHGDGGNGTWPSEAFPLYNIPSVSGTFSCDDRSMMSYDSADDASSVRSGRSFRSVGSVGSSSSRHSSQMVYHYDAKTGKTKLTRQDSYGRDRLDEMINQSLTPRQLRERRRQKRREALQREAREKQKQRIRAAAAAAARRESMSMSMNSGGSLSSSGRSRPRRRDSFSSISTSDSSRDFNLWNGGEGGDENGRKSLLGGWFSSSKSECSNHSATKSVEASTAATEQSSSSNMSSLGDWSSAFSSTDDVYSVEENLNHNKFDVDDEDDEDDDGNDTDGNNYSYYDGTNGHDTEGEDASSVCTVGTTYSSSYYNGRNNKVHPAPMHQEATPPRRNSSHLKKHSSSNIRPLPHVGSAAVGGEVVEEHNYQRLAQHRNQQQLHVPSRHHQVGVPPQGHDHNVDDDEDFEQLHRRLQQRQQQYKQERESAAAAEAAAASSQWHKEQVLHSHPSGGIAGHAGQSQSHPQQGQVQQMYNKPTVDAAVDVHDDDMSSPHHHQNHEQQQRPQQRSHPKCSNNHKMYELGAVYGKVKSGKALQQYVLQQLRLQQVLHQQRYGVNRTGVADECDEELHEKQRRLVKRWKNMHCRECRVKIGLPSSCFHELQKQQQHQYHHANGSMSDQELYCSSTTNTPIPPPHRMMMAAAAGGASAVAAVARGKLPSSRKPVYVCLSCHYRAVCSSCWNRRVANM